MSRAAAGNPAEASTPAPRLGPSGDRAPAACLLKKAVAYQRFEKRDGMARRDIQESCHVVCQRVQIRHERNSCRIRNSSASMGAAMVIVAAATE